MKTRIRQGTLALQALPRFIATMSPSDSRPGQSAVIHSRCPLARLRPWVRATRPGLSGSSLICRRPLSSTTPGSPTAAYARCFTVGVRLRPFWKVGHSQV